MARRQNYTKAKNSPRVATTQPIDVYFPVSPVKADAPLAGVGVDELVVGATSDVLARNGEVVVPAAEEGDVSGVELVALGLLVVAGTLNENVPLEVLL